MPYAKGRIVEDKEPSISYGRSPLLPASDYDKMLANINKITAQLRSVPCIGTEQGVDIHISKAIGKAKPAQVVIFPEKVATFHGYDIYWLEDNVEYAVITKKNISPFVPISQEDYYKACVKKYSNSTEVGIGFVVDRYKEKLSKLSAERRKQQAVVNMESEDFSEESAGRQPKYFITNPQLVERSRSNEIQLITISWSKTSADKPLRLYKGGKDGFDIKYYILKQHLFSG